MLVGNAIAALTLVTTRTFRRWFLRLGGPGLILLALLDNSPIPTPGAMDIATIILAARQPELWLYYALMATLGSVIGGFITYRVSRKGGKAALERRFSRRRIDSVIEIFERWGFSAIAIPAVLPPPMPMVPFIFAAGAMQYPAKKFLAALTLGRTARYMILAYLAAHYGRKVIAFIVSHGHPAVVGSILAVIAIVAAAYYFWPAGLRKKNRSHVSAHRP